MSLRVRLVPDTHKPAVWVQWGEHGEELRAQKRGADTRITDGFLKFHTSS